MTALFSNCEIRDGDACGDFEVALLLTRVRMDGKTLWTLRLPWWSKRLPFPRYRGVWMQRLLVIEPGAIRLDWLWL